MDWIEYRQARISYAILHAAETALEITPAIFHSVQAAKFHEYRLPAQ